MPGSLPPPVPRTHAGFALRASAQRRISSWSISTCDLELPRPLSIVRTLLRPLSFDRLAVFRRARVLAERVDADVLLLDDDLLLVAVRFRDVLRETLLGRDAVVRRKVLADFRDARFFLAVPFFFAAARVRGFADALERDVVRRPALERAVVERGRPLRADAALSRDTILLKLLRCPRAVLSWTSKASPRSSNLSNHSSQSICSSVPAPE
jgi:hypothetical protein